MQSYTFSLHFKCFSTAFTLF